MGNTVEFNCTKTQRLDVFLTPLLKQTRSQISQLIKQNCVFVNGKPLNRPGIKLKTDDKVKIIFPEPKHSQNKEIDFDVEILYEDDDVLLINKPTSLTVHPAPSVKEATLVDWLKHKGIRLSTISGEERHGIVHRLDKGTSGAMVVAKNNEAHEFLSKQLQDKSMGRYYLAVINPPLKDEFTTIECSIGRSTSNRLKMACKDDAKAKYAKSVFKILTHSNDEKLQLVACKLFTGRTHQIRVHLESINRHIIGDHIYALSPKLEKSERILLHAYIIYFTHPKTKKTMMFSAPLDKNMKIFLEKKFNMEKIDELIQIDNILHAFPVAN